MNETKIELETNISYDSIPFPKKIIIPIEEGNFLVFSYKQHETDPLAVERVKFEYGGGNQIKIGMRGTGRLAVDNFPDVRIGGTKIEVKAGLIFKNTKLCIQHPELTNLDLPNIPNFTDDFFQDILNQYLLPNLEKKLQLDLYDTIENARTKINKPIPFNINIGREEYRYELKLFCELIEPALNISSDGIQIKIYFGFKPEITMD